MAPLVCASRGCPSFRLWRSTKARGDRRDWGIRAFREISERSKKEHIAVGGFGGSALHQTCCECWKLGGV